MGEKLLDPPCQGILMVMLPQCHDGEDQALSCFYCQKSCLKITLSQGNWYPQPHSESKSFQVFQLSCFFLDQMTDQITGQVFFSLNVNGHSTLWYFCSVHERVCVCFRPGKIRACRTVELLTSDSCRLFKLSSNHCSVIWPASVADTVKTRAGFAKTGLDWMVLWLPWMLS